MTNRTTHHLFCWRTGPATDIARKGTRYHFSIRPVNNLKNSVDHNSYRTRSMRNKKVNELIDLPKYKGKIKVIRDTNPNKKAGK